MKLTISGVNLAFDGCAQFHNMKLDQFFRRYRNCSRPSIFTVSVGICWCFTHITAYFSSTMSKSLATSDKNTMSASKNSAQPLNFCKAGTRNRVCENSVEKGLPSIRSIKFPVGPSTSHGRANMPDCRSSRCFRYLIATDLEVLLRIEWAATSEATASRPS